MLNILSKWPTGSRYICNPAPTDTDNDTVILVSDIEAATKDLVANGWEVGGSLNINKIETLMEILFDRQNEPVQEF
jgi:aspartyl-tRNA synthetase